MGRGDRTREFWFAIEHALGGQLRWRRKNRRVRDASGNVIGLDGTWGLIFGNGASLGDTNALYFAAGTDGEAAGLFGSLRYVG